MTIKTKFEIGDKVRSTIPKMAIEGVVQGFRVFRPGEVITVVVYQLTTGALVTTGFYDSEIQLDE